MKLIELAVWLVLSAGSFAALRLTPERVTQDLMQVLNPPADAVCAGHGAAPQTGENAQFSVPWRTFGMRLLG